MTTLKNDWQLFSDKKYNVIRDDEFTIISSDVADYHTAKKILRCREMYELMEKLLLSNEPAEAVLQEIKFLKQEIDKM